MTNQSQHEAECSTEIQATVTKWLYKNTERMQLLMWDFQEECESNLKFKYKRSQFRCWVWDTMIAPKTEEK